MAFRALWAPRAVCPGQSRGGTLLCAQRLSDHDDPAAWRADNQVHRLLLYPPRTAPLAALLCRARRTDRCGSASPRDMALLRLLRHQLSVGVSGAVWRGPAFLVFGRRGAILPRMAADRLDPAQTG